jgi:colanic acid/amylovoran biosynthesis protein
MMFKILLQGTADHHLSSCESNLGGAAVATAAVETLRTFFPGSQIASLVQFSPGFSSALGIRVIQNRQFRGRHYAFDESLRAGVLLLRAGLWALFHKYFHWNMKLLTNHRIIREYAAADLIVDISMDCFNDMYGSLPALDHCRDILMGRLLGKPVVLYAQSPGPFNNRLVRWSARWALNKMDLITVREKLSVDYLKRIGVRRPVYLTTDPAFLFKPAPKEQIQALLSPLKTDNRPLIAIVPPDGMAQYTLDTPGSYRKLIKTGFVSSRYFLPERLFMGLANQVSHNRWIPGFRSSTQKNTFSILAEVADYLVKKYDANIILIPHVVWPDDHFQHQSDARMSVGQIYALAGRKDRITAITGILTADRTKALIGQCDSIITFKMHAGIAALSQFIPALVIAGQHQKFRGIMGSVGMEEWTTDRISADLIENKFEEMWSRKEEISQSLKNRMPDIREQALLNGKLVKDLMESRKSPGTRKKKQA